MQTMKILNTRLEDFAFVVTGLGPDAWDDFTLSSHEARLLLAALRLAEAVTQVAEGDDEDWLGIVDPLDAYRAAKEE